MASFNPVDKNPTMGESGVSIEYSVSADLKAGWGKAIGGSIKAGAMNDELGNYQTMVEFSSAKRIDMSGVSAKGKYQIGYE